MSEGVSGGEPVCFTACGGVCVALPSSHPPLKEGAANMEATKFTQHIEADL